MIKARHNLATAQADFLSSHGDVDCLRQERECLHALVSITAAQENFLKQKSWNNWLNLGDENTTFFHKVVKARNSYNLIKVLKDEEGNRIMDMQHIKDLVVGFYQNILGRTSHVFSQVEADKVSCLFRRKFSPSCVAGMQGMVTITEVQKVIFSMNKNKALGPDGFSAGFFHKA